MSQLSKFINLVIEYGQKVQSTLNKKYKPFIRSICNLQQLAKTVDPQNIFLTREMIIFKLGLQAKSTKSIEVSLFYLHKFFINKFIDLNIPNYCEEFEIQQTTVRRRQNINPKTDFRSEIIKMLEPLIHFKNNDINQLLLRVYQFLITEPIAPILIELNLMTPNTQIGQKILFNYFSYRFYIFEEIYTFTEEEFRSINPLAVRNQRINQQIEAAFVNHQNLLDLIHKYVGEIVVTVAGIGGKYGLCVICKQPADYYCKITKASLCGPDCKKRHLQIAQKQYKGYYQSVNLWRQIQPNFELLLQTLTKKQSRCILSVLVGLLQKSHLFMIIKKRFRQIIGTHVTGIISMILSYKDQQSFEIIYNFIAVLCRYWMVEAMSSIEYFFKESVLKLLEDKKPNFKMLIILFKSLAKIFQYGKTTIQLYVNFDCEYNKTNIMERILFQLSKICQDKFASSLHYNKHEKVAIKNGAVTLLCLLAKGINQYRTLYPQKVVIVQQILQIKQRKINLQKFVHKFNQHWSEGLKTLFNLNMVGLQSQIQIAQILLATKGLRKEKIQQMLLNQNGRQYIQSIFQCIIKAGPFMGLVQLFRIVPLKKSSVLLKHYSDFVLTKMIKSVQDDNNQKEQYSVTKWVGFLAGNYTLKQLEKWLYMQNIKINGPLEHVFMKCLQTKNQLTLGTHKTYFRHCISQSYLEVFASQLSLLQIPILFLLQTSYQHEKIFEIITELIQICPHANWITLCLKNIDIEKIKAGKYSLEDHSLIINCLKLCKTHAQFIHDWSPILQFICKLYKIITNDSHKKLSVVVTTSVILEQPIKIREQLTILQLQQYLLMIGQNSTKNFGNYIVSLIHLSQQQLQKQNIFFLQKTFQIIQHNNLFKFIKNYKIIQKELENLIGKIMKRNVQILKGNKKQEESQRISSQNNIQTIYSSQTLIYIADMLKQLFVKILKQLDAIQKDNKQNPKILPLKQLQTQQMIQLSFFNLFSLILQCENRQANDFVMNSISMIIMVHFGLKSQTWSYIVQNILKQYCKQYRQQVLTILQKILKEKLEKCEHLEFELLSLTLDLVDDKEVKLSIESLHMLKDFVDLMVEEMNQYMKQIKENQNSKLKMIKQQQINESSRQQKMKSIQEKQQQNIAIQEVEQQPKTQVLSVQQAMSPKSSYLSEQQQSQASLLLLSSSPKKIKQYLLLILSNLIQFISYECHQGAIQILFILLKTKLPISAISLLKNEQQHSQQQKSQQKQKTRIKDQEKEIKSQKDIKTQKQLEQKEKSQQNTMQLIFYPEEINLIINKIFKKLQSLPKQLHQRGQKIMNESLFWSVRNKMYGIVKNLQQCIINKYSSMSYTAMKCIKTFISMTNPKKSQDWNPIEQTLVKILKNTHLDDLLSKVSINYQDCPDIQKLIYQEEIQLNLQQKLGISLTELSNKLIIQRMTVEVLPNDVKIIQQLLEIYQQTVRFNDNLYLRCLLWKEGLGSSSSDSPPDILSLEELISYRIISTYYWSKQYQKIAEFTLRIIQRYCKASQKWQNLESEYQNMESNASNKKFELYILCRDYWRKRIQPLKVIINYMLPKLPKICKEYSHKEKLLHGIIEGMKFCQERAPYVETIRQMTLVR